MDPALISLVLGPMVGLSIGLGSHFFKRSIDHQTAQISTLFSKVDTLIETAHSNERRLPELFVTKNELALHIQLEEQWQSHVNSEVNELKADLKGVKDELISVRSRIDESCVVLRELKEEVSKNRFLNQYPPSSNIPPY